jgi:hypothetical protein
VYGREVDGEVLSFGHSGILYENSFVMYDRKTQSLWVHVTGRAEAGPMKGKRLPFLPSTVTTWAQWKAHHPHTLVLPGRRRDGFMGTYDGLDRPVDLGLAVVVRFKGKLYPFRSFERVPLVNDRFEDTPIIVFFSRRDGTAVAWERRVDGRELTFTMSERSGRGEARLLRDRETGTLWSWLTGEGIEGPLKGARLASVAHNPILVERFRAFYPGGAVFEAPQPKLPRH